MSKLAARKREKESQSESSDIVSLSSKMSDSKPQNDVTRYKLTSFDATKNGYQTVGEGHHYKKGSITSF